MGRFMEMLKKHQSEGKLVCVGHDSDLEQLPTIARQGLIPREAVLEFNKAISLSVGRHICSFKPNIAFYSSKDFDLRWALSQTIKYINRMFPDVPVILDSKRGDTGNTNIGYVIEAFEEFGAHAVTVNPYPGHDPEIEAPAFEPFLRNHDIGVFVVIRMSNKDAPYFQDRMSLVNDKELDWVKQHGIDQDELGWWNCGNNIILAPQYQLRAIDVAQNWNKNGNCGLVVGATAPAQLAAARRLVGNDMPILAPGTGEQQADVEAALRAGLTPNGDGIIISASRSVIFAAKDHTYPEAARKEVERLNADVKKIRQLILNQAA